jgi:hypothetical protein
MYMGAGCNPRWRANFCAQECSLWLGRSAKETGRCSREVTRPAIAIAAASQSARRRTRRRNVERRADRLCRRALCPVIHDEHRYLAGAVLSKPEMQKTRALECNGARLQA